MIPIVRTYSSNPVFLSNIYRDEYCGGKTENFTQKVNISETEKNYLIEILVPGFEKSEIKVSVDKNELTIASLDNKEQNIENKLNYLRHEYQKQAFSRSFLLPEHVETDKIEALHQNGILSISLPKKAKVEIPVQEIEIA